MNQIYGFEGEVKAKYTAQMYELFSEVFEWLPLAQCINGKVLVRSLRASHTAQATRRGGGGGAFPHRGTCFPQIMHGGLFSEDGVTLDDIRKIERNRQPPDSGEWARAQRGVPPPTRPYVDFLPAARMGGAVLVGNIGVFDTYLLFIH